MQDNKRKCCIPYRCRYIILTALQFLLDAMCVDEAKRIFQGGVQYIPKKHGTAIRIEYNSGIYVTMNEVICI